MSSSQGGSVGSSTNQVSAGYTFDQDSIRDGSDWTSFKRQALIYKDYNSASATQTRPAWDMRGNNFRLSYGMGQFKCKSITGTCATGGAFNSLTVPIPSGGLPF
jgi:hypothetical protein